MPPPASLRQGRSSSTPRSRPAHGYDQPPPMPQQSLRGYPSPPQPHVHAHAYSEPAHLATPSRRSARDPGGSHEHSSSSGSNAKSLRSQKSSPAMRSSARPEAVPVQPPRQEVNPVLARMAAAGWGGVELGGGEEGQNDGARGGKYGSIDSGYGESEQEEQQQEGLGAWGFGKLKKAVWGEDDGGSGAATPVPHVRSAPGAGSAVWDKLTVKLQALSTSVASPWAQDDDDTVGDDGETKLGRAIREHHFSRASCPADVPTWCFTPSELAARQRSGASSSNSRGQSRTNPTPPSPRPSLRGRRRSSGSAAAARAYQVANARADEMGRSTGQRGGGGTQGSPEAKHVPVGGGGTRAEQRLRAMKEARRGGCAPK